MRLVLVAALAALAPLAHAQLGLGAAGGANAFALGDVPGYAAERGAGFHAGAFLDIGERPFALRIGLFYVDAGEVAGEAVPARFPVDPADPRAGDTTLAVLPALGASVAHLAIPLELHYRFDLGRVTPYGLFGPNIRVLLGSTEALAETTRKPSTVALTFGAGTLFENVFGGEEGEGPQLFAEVRYVFDAAGTFAQEEFVIDRDGQPAPPDAVDAGQLRTERLTLDLFMLRTGIIF